MTELSAYDALPELAHDLNDATRGAWLETNMLFQIVMDLSKHVPADVMQTAISKARQADAIARSMDQKW